MAVSIPEYGTSEKRLISDTAAKIKCFQMLKRKQALKIRREELCTRVYLENEKNAE